MSSWKWPDIQQLQAEARSDDDKDWPPTLRDGIQRYFDHLKETADADDPEALNPSSAEDYRKDFNWFEMWLRMNKMDIEDIVPFDALDIGVYVGNNYAGSTAGKRFRNIRRLFGYLRKGGAVDNNPFDEWSTKADCGITESQSEQQKQLEDGERYGPTLKEIDQIVANVGEDHQTRDRLLIRLLRDSGARASELRGIKSENIDLNAREIYLHPDICKYNKPRTVAYKRDTGVLLQDWLDKYRLKEAYRYSEYLFPTSQSPCISTDRIEDTVTESANRAGLNRDLWEDANGNTRSKLTPHNIRYSTGYYMLFDEDDNARPEANIYKVSRYLGHASVNVTERVYIEDNPRAGVDAGHDLMPD